MNKKRNIIEEAYGFDTSNIIAWIKEHGLLIMIVGLIGFAFGYQKGQGAIMLDCKYAKAIRIDTEAFKCEKSI